MTPIFNENKAINALLYVAERLKMNDFHKIFKILYFADMNHLSKYARPITGDTYIAMDFGAVPTKLYDMLKSAKLSCQSPYSTLFEVEGEYHVKPIAQANMDYLSPTDIAELDKSISEYGNLNWKETVEKAHRHAWSHTQRNQPISIENMLEETNCSKEYIEYVKSNISMQKSILNATAC